KNITNEVQALGIVDATEAPASEDAVSEFTDSIEGSSDLGSIDLGQPTAPEEVVSSQISEPTVSASATSTAAAVAPAPERQAPAAPTYKPGFGAADLQEALEVVQQLDPPGVGCRDLRECLLHQLRFHQAQLTLNKNGTAQVLEDAIAIVDQHLRAVQNKQHK